MKALVYKDTETLDFTTVPVPDITDPKDVIVRVTFASICSSDIHIIKGAVPRAKKGTVLGHEGVGVVVKVGSEVNKIHIGDHVSINCITFCGECWFCKHGYINNCEKGGWEVGCRINGTLAEYVRIPFGDQSLNVIPAGVSDKECLLVGDVLSSGFFGVDLGEVKEGDTVAVIGCGPVGLCSMMFCHLRKAKVIGIDINPQCVAFAEDNKYCDWALNPNECDIKKEVSKLTDGRGVDCTIENAGTDETFRMSWELTRPNGIVSLVAMYERDQVLPLPQMYGKNLVFKTGGVDATHCDELIELISQHRLSAMGLITREFELCDVLDAVEFFRTKPSHCVKVAISVRPE